MENQVAHHSCIVQKAFMALLPWKGCPPGRYQKVSPFPLVSTRNGGAIQLAQDFRFSGLLWLLSPLANAAVSEAKLVAEPEMVALLRASGAP